ncbi:MAG: cbb3-type cytochrome oxidase assembly protein CcoS [Planctomycetaceae bacterium]|nr:cbb3-type cytochrome oxidase assembly protein CcoS [Planctomycetaceae bacterium]
MSLIYLILPIALIVAGLALAAFLWALRTGQYDDLDTPPQRQLLGDERD